MSRSIRDYAAALVISSLGALGGAAAVFGEIDDAPGLILIGMLLALGAAALHLRATGKRR